MHVSYFLESHLLNLLFFVLGCSGRELFMSDASLFVDDAEAYEKYQREEESDAPENKVLFFLVSSIFSLKLL